jgi:hypothetical protein
MSNAFLPCVGVHLRRATYRGCDTDAMDEKSWDEKSCADALATQWYVIVLYVTQASEDHYLSLSSKILMNE